MNFEIILHELPEDAKEQSINWFLSGEHSLKCAVPLSYLSVDRANVNIESDLIRRAGAEVYDFLRILNNGYHQTHKFKSINICYANKTRYKNVRVLDNFLEGFTLANYEFNNHKTSVSSNVFNIETSFSSHLCATSIEGAFIARDLVNEPLSHLNAEALSRAIQNLSKEAGFSVEVFDEKKIKDLNMGGVLSVNKGSIAKPTFNILTYNKSSKNNKQPIVLVGKGVMYDTGGLSLKPTPNSMDMMKSDMAGAAAVVGIIYALAKAKIDTYVVGLIPAVENRPGGEAYVPGDVITMMSGQTVEVLNTDAEGRLILADALHYAKKYNPKLVIDIATLTGAAVRTVGRHGIVAMENYNKPIFSDFSDSMKSLLTVGDVVGEKIAIQPFWDDYRDELKSTIADIKNLGGAEAGHVTAGKFLEHFVDYPWIHLDIASLAFLQKEYIYHKAGGTGIGVRLLVNFIANYQ